MESPEKSGIFNKLKKTMSKSRSTLTTRLNGVFSRNKLDDDFWDEIEEVLISSDMGVSTTMKVVSNIKVKAKQISSVRTEDVWGLLKEELSAQLLSSPLILLQAQPIIVLMVGVNGSGKTTTVGKLAKRQLSNGKKVLIAAGDTYRAAAIEQVEEVARRVGAPIVTSQRGANPSAVTFDAVKALLSRDMDILFIDTAGRLQSYQNLMNELSKVKSIAVRESQGRASVISLLVLDSTTGQNGIAQARAFNEAVTIDGVILTKLDGSAKGGIVFAICNELNLPVAFIGTGEKMEDIEPFNPLDFTDALLEGSSD